jgi:site-specific recombinase XerD
VQEFFDTMGPEGGLRRSTPKALAWLLAYLRDIGVTPTPTPRAPQSREEALVERYQRYLVAERSLVAEVVADYARVAMLWLTDHPDRDLKGLGIGDVTRFMTGHCRDLKPKSAANLAIALRSFLRFLLLDGLIAVPLAEAVPSAATWADAALPRGLAPRQVAALLATCDRRRACGRRDYAILVLLARLGLRAAEVAQLRLDDIDWRAGEIVVRGKGRTEERLPLPSDVGAAMAGYLRRGRPHRPEREVFLRVVAPLRGLRSEGVSYVVRNASERAGIGSFGSHRLRHTAATAMLRAGASLSEVGQVLRHRSVSTTAIYAKVDHVALREVAKPWPGCER